MNKRLESLLYSFIDGVIKNFSFNFQNNKILISLDLHCKDEIQKYELIFFCVSSFYFLNDEGSRRFNFNEPTHLWLTEIDYFKNGIGKIKINSNEEWSKLYYSGANFILEICQTILFIEAKAIQINDEYFHVGFPPKNNKPTETK